MYFHSSEIKPSCRLGWVILYKVGQWISSCHFYYAKFNSEQLLFYWCIWKKLIYLRKFGPEDFVYPYIKSNFKFWILRVVIYPEMHIKILRSMVKELAQSNLQFLRYSKKTANFYNLLRNCREWQFFGLNSIMVSRIKLVLSP